MQYQIKNRMFVKFYNYTQCKFYSNSINFIQIQSKIINNK